MVVFVVSAFMMEMVAVETFNSEIFEMDEFIPVMFAW